MFGFMVSKPRNPMVKKDFSIMKLTQIITVAFLSSFLAFCVAGCGDKFFDPTQVGRFRPVPAVNVILDSLGVEEETPWIWEGAEDPRPVDIITFEADYVFGTGDIVQISIFELRQQNVRYINNFVVTESGKISIPEVGAIEVLGLTEVQLEEEIRQILMPSVLKDPSITVILVTSQKRTYSILGNAVPQPGRYSIPRYDFRLNDALATAQVNTQFNTSYIFVSRFVTGEEEIVMPLKPEVSEPQELVVPEDEMLEVIRPHAKGRSFDNKFIITSAEMITDEELTKAALPEDFKPIVNEAEEQVDIIDAQQTREETTDRETIDAPINENRIGRIEWVFQNGRWVPVQIGQPEPAGPDLKVGADRTPKLPVGELPERFDWNQIGTGGVQTRVIKIPADKLAGGDPRYNIIVRPSDTIHVPVDIIGEFCIMGNVNNQGFIPITGRPLTLKMAIAAAGGLGPLAWPKRCEVVRRIGKKKEEIVMVDLDKIASGEQPDFFIKPNDLINVGTHPTARLRAVLRNAFRATYGFGFIYDRNFSDRDFGTSRPIPSWLF